MTLKDQLSRDEGRSAVLYYDSANIPTIGIGRNLKRGLSEDEIDYLFNNDFLNHSKDLIRAFPWVGDIDEIRRDVLINMVFNLGVVRLSGFHHFLAAMEAQDWDGAARHMLNSIWASQVKGRAFRLAQQVITGVRQ